MGVVSSQIRNPMQDVAQELLQKDFCVVQSFLSPKARSHGYSGTCEQVGNDAKRHARQNFRFKRLVKAGSGPTASPIHERLV